jgi:hypothetical protein
VNNKLIKLLTVFLFSCLLTNAQESDKKDYPLKADFVDNGNSTEKNWTESVIFKKIKGKWKIELIHSTPIKTK